MERLEKLGREAKYDTMVKPPCASAMAAGKRRPAYINYTPEGRKKGRVNEGSNRNQRGNHGQAGRSVRPATIVQCRVWH